MADNIFLIKEGTVLDLVCNPGPVAGIFLNKNSAELRFRGITK
jgi:hypothetical protein